MDNVSGSEMDEENPDTMKSENELREPIEYNGNSDDSNGNSDAQPASNKCTFDKGKEDEKSNEVKMEIDGFKVEDYSGYMSDEDVVRSRYKNRRKRSIVPVATYEESEHIQEEEEEEEYITNDYNCEICSQTHTTRAELIAHKKIHGKIITYKCALCSTTFKTNKQLINHKLVHKNEETEFACTTKTCKKKFTNHLEFLLHKFEHTKPRHLSCIECNKRDIKNAYLKQHIQTHFDTNMVECEICHEMVRPASIKVHKLNHGERPNECVECGKRFSTPGCLRDHMPLHTGVKIYQCLYCGKGFHRAQGCRIHTRTHTGERPYKCRLCDKAFYQMTDRNYHEERHSKVRYNCEVCGKDFKGKTALKLHMTMHNNTQKYECKVCGKKIHTNTGLRDHLERFHTDSSYYCEVCNRKLSSKKDLARHQQSKLHQNAMYGLSLKQEESIT